MDVDILADARVSARASFSVGQAACGSQGVGRSTLEKAVMELQLTCQRGSSSNSSLTWEKRMLRVMALLSSSMVSKSCSSNACVRTAYAAGQEWVNPWDFKFKFCAGSSIAAGHTTGSWTSLCVCKHHHQAACTLHLAILTPCPQEGLGIRTQHVLHPHSCQSAQPAEVWEVTCPGLVPFTPCCQNPGKRAAGSGRC